MNKFRPILILSLFILFMVSLGAISAEELNSTVVNDAQATDSIYVDSNATIGGNGALNNPMNNIKDAVNSVDNNSVIHVKGGNYYTSDNSRIIINKTITIESYDGTAVINGKYTDYIFYITDKGSLTLKNIEFLNTEYSTVKTYSAIVNYGNLNVENSFFDNATGLRAGIILNYGNLTVNNSEFKNNTAKYYGGAITNFGFANIVNSLFESNTAAEGEAILNTYDMFISNSRFIDNNISSNKYQKVESLIDISSSYFTENSDIFVKDSGIYIKESYVTLINTSNSVVDISYSFINTYDFVNSRLSIDNNFWCSNENIPKQANRWLIMIFVDKNTGSSIIKSKSVVDVLVTFKACNGKSTYNLPSDVRLPSVYIQLEADNGRFKENGGYLINNAFLTTYFDNSKNTLIFAMFDDSFATLTVGSGFNNGKIYVSTSGSDEKGDGSINNPYKSLTKAVSVALNGDIIFIGKGSYSGLYNSGLLINKTLTFSSYNGEVKLCRDDFHTMFTISPRGVLTLKGLTLSAMDKSKFIPLVNNSGKTVIDNCIIKDANGGNKYVFKGNEAQHYQYFSNQSIIYTSNDLIINNSVFSNLEDIVIRSYFYTGSNYFKHFDVTIENSVFTNCKAMEWGTIWDSKNYMDKADVVSPSFIINVGAENVLIDNCTFRDNTASAVRVNASKSFLVDNSRFIRNHGSIYSLTTGVLNNTLITEDYGPSVGFFQQDLIPIIRNMQSIVNSNFTKNKEVIISTSFVHYGDNIYLYNCYFGNNTNYYAQDHRNSSGEGLILNGGNMTVDYCTFENNSVFYGGVFYNDGTTVSPGKLYYSKLDITNSIFYNNNAVFGKDIFNKGGEVFVSDCWWGSNRGPNDENIYKAAGTVNVKNWVILTFDIEDNTLIGSLNKVTDSKGNIYNITGKLPSRIAIFESSMVKINPNVIPLINNQAKVNISFNGEDISASLRVDNQTISLVFYNKNTVFDLKDIIVYGKGTSYSFILKSVNGYVVSNKTVTLLILNGTNVYQKHILTTNALGVATLIINCSMGNYTFKASYDGDNYFKPTQGSAKLVVMPYYTSIFIKGDQTFYGNGNFIYAHVYDNLGDAMINQMVLFTITSSNGNVYNRYALTDWKGQAGFYLNLSGGNYKVDVSYSGDNWHYGSSTTGLFNILSIGTNVIIEQSLFNGRGNTLTVLLRDNNYRVLFNETVEIILSDGKVSQAFKVTTNENGRAGVVINLVPGKYNVYVKYAGNKLNSPSSAEGDMTINHVPTQISASSVIIFDSTMNSYLVKLTDIYGRLLVNETIIITAISQATGVKQIFKVKTNGEGIANLTCKLDIGNYLLKIDFNDNEWYDGSNYASTLIVVDTVDDFNPYATILVANDLVKFYKNGTQYIVRLQDIYGNPISNMEVVISINGVKYTRITNSSGEAKLNINLAPGVYHVNVTFEGYGDWTESFVNSSVTVLSQIISKDLTKILRNGSQFIVKFVDNAGNPIEGKLISISINGIVYSRVTNSSGEAKLSINLNPGKYDVVTSCGDFVNHNVINVLSNIDSDDLSMYYRDGSKFKVVIYDSEGKVKPNATVKFTVNGVSYTRITDKDGVAALSINLNSNIYTITTEYNGIVNTNQIWIYNMAVNMDAVNETVKKGTAFYVKLIDVNGNAISGGQVSFKINGVSYIRSVNETGYAKLNINLNPGVYKIITAFSIRNYEDKLLYNTLKVTDTN